MHRSMSIRNRRAAKAPVAPPEDLHANEQSLRTVPYSSTTKSSPPIWMGPIGEATGPSAPCSRPPSPLKPITTTSSIYPDSAHSTVLPSSARSSFLARWPAMKPKSPSVTPSPKYSSRFAAVAGANEDTSSAWASTYEVDAQNRLPAYLGPHIIGSEGDEEQRPEEAFVVPAFPRPPFSVDPPGTTVQQATTRSTGPASSWSSRRNSKCADSQSDATTSKKIKSRLRSTFRLGGKKSAKSSREEPPPPLLLSEHTRDVRLGSNADTVTTEESVMTPDGAGPWEAIRGDLDGAGLVKEQHGRSISESGAADGVAGCQLVNQGRQEDEAAHTIAMDIPGDSQFGNEFWARFPRCFV